MVEDKWKIKLYLPPLKTPLYTIDSEVLVEVEDVLHFFSTSTESSVAVWFWI